MFLSKKYTSSFVMINEGLENICIYFIDMLPVCMLQHVVMMMYNMCVHFQGILVSRIISVTVLVFRSLHLINVELTFPRISRLCIYSICIHLL